jgi:hypothetical protein
VAADRVNTAEWNKVVDMLEGHLTDLRNDARYRRAVIYAYVENNSSFTNANEVRRVLEQPRFYPVVVKSFDSKKEQRYGVWTGAAEKEMYALEMKRALGDGRLCYADKFISRDKGMKTEILSQLEHYRKELKVSPSGKKTYEYTGKGGGRKDDVCIVLQMILYWSMLERQTPEYMHAAEENGWRL